MMLMIIAVLVVVGLAIGSFINALVWRLHEQEQESKKPKPNKDYLKLLSVSRGRSICPHCRHQLASKDLVPLLSWLSLGGKCRYCHKPISPQYPLVELITALVFVASYIWWPYQFNDSQITQFVFWLWLVAGLIALLVYDLKWMLLPNRLVYPLTIIAAFLAGIRIAAAARPLTELANTAAAVAIGGGIFYLIFQLSNGKWIGGGDVKLGWLLGLAAGTATRSLLLIFIASILGSLVSLPLLASKKLKKTSVIPFGPFLIVAVMIVQLFGATILGWYGGNLLK